MQPAEASEHRAAARAIALGTVRWYLRLAPAVETLLNRAPRSLVPELWGLLVAAAHQIEYSRTAPELAVNVAVDASRVLGQARASGFVNAVLRRFVAERATILAKLDGDLATRSAHPRWLVDSLAVDWPAQLETVLQAGNVHPPLVLRVDLNRESREGCIRELAHAGITASAVDWLPTAVIVEEPIPVARIPGFAAGKVSVQDAGAQLAAPLLEARPGMRVLDACAAPGGKTGHLLEHTADIELTSVDNDRRRLERIRQNLERLQRQANVLCGDVRFPDSFWDSRPFQRILLDAPCSSTGVIRRHPDIKLLRRASDIPALAAAQLQLLASAFRMLAEGGRLLYVTCSILAAETEGVLTQFLAGESRAIVVRLELPARGSSRGRAGVQLLPGSEAGTDGFYYACLEKTTIGT